MASSREMTALGRQAVLDETIRKEMRAAARADDGGRARFAPSIYTAVRHKFTPQPGHEPSAEDLAAAGSAELQEALASMHKTPKERQRAGLPLPRTQAQEIGWYAQSGSLAKISMLQSDWNPDRQPNISCTETRFAGEYYKMRGTMPHFKSAERGGQPHRPGVLN